ncbi:MAG: GNAT family N-acetyltransferase [Parachlamydiales bacterium]|nr:GNAT family N-acetyltransferase [Parachlamydiales bacterium]
MKCNNNLVLQILEKEHLSDIIKTFIFPWTTLKATTEKWEQYYQDQEIGNRTVCIAKIDNQLIGYGTLIKDSKYPFFKIAHIPEINDVRILEEYQGRGFGKQLIQYLENIALIEQYQEIGIGVGLYKDYGNAQKLYVRMGYVPDGNGITYNYQQVTPGSSYTLDDDLIIWLKKDLGKNRIAT